MLNKLIAQLSGAWHREPAAFMYGISAALIPVLSVWLHWDVRQTAAAAAVLTALSTIVAAVKARPVSVPILLSGASAIAAALAAWKIRIPAADMALFTSATTALLGALLRANLTPVVTLRPPVPKA